MGTRAFYFLFNGCDKIVDASDLKLPYNIVGKGKNESAIFRYIKF